MARIRVQAERFDIGAEYEALAVGPQIGGVGCFVGRVRGEADLVALTLEHYPGMTERSLEAIVARAEAQWDLLGCTVIHRIGRLAVGEPIVLVIAASRHRRDALQATQFLIDWLKTDAPFWKCEEHRDGARTWVVAG
jgi:molybdopterin synthase catalytic subunit